MKISSRSRSPVARRSSPGAPCSTISAAGQDDDAVGERSDLLHDVARQQDAAALGAQPPQEVAHGAAGRHIEPVGGLVEHDIVRPVHQGAAERDLHLLAAGKALGPPVNEILHAQGRHQFVDALLELVAGNAMQRAEVAQMLARRQPWI